jgi:hypothetical protein
MYHSNPLLVEIMKKTFLHILAIILMSGAMFSCHDLYVPVTTELTPDVFPQMQLNIFLLLVQPMWL